MKQWHLVHQHHQMRAIGDKTLLLLTRLVCLVTFVDYTGSCNYNSHMQDLVTKQQRLVHLHHQMRALGDKILHFLTRLVSLVMFVDHTGLCNSHTQRGMMK